MRIVISQVSLSAVPTRIRHVKAFTGALRKKINAWIAALAPVTEAYSLITDDDDRYTVRQYDELGDYHAPQLIKRLTAILDDLGTDVLHMQKMLFGNYGSAARFLEYVRDAKADLESSISRFEQYFDGDRSRWADDYGPGAARYFAAYAEAIPAVQSLMRDAPQVLADAKAKLDETLRPGDSMPEVEEIEALFHATAFVPEILRDGFAPTKPSGRRGLGLYGSQDGVSLTHDLHIAKEIARCLKEALLIVQGKLTYPTILDWARREKLDVAQMEAAVNGMRSDWKPAAKTLYLYNVYLWHTKIRSNPVFTSIEDLEHTLRGRSISDIGVLKCWTKMAGTTYKRAESEVIAPPQNILKVERL